MIDIVWNKSFLSILKKWEKKHPELIESLKRRLELFIEDPYNPKLKTHQLKGDLDGLYSFSVNYEYRLVFKFSSDKLKAILVDIGTHDEVY